MSFADAGSDCVGYLSNVTVNYPGRPTLGPLDLTVGSKEIIAIVGASGAGKSTVLHLLAGLEHGQGTVARALDKRRTGLVFQSPTLMPWADALTNVALPLELAGVPAAESRRRAGLALASVGLGDRSAARPRELSGGMAMRVSLARALAIEPDLLLLDEPFAALDTVTRRGLIEDLHALWHQRALSMVFVTHDVEEAAYLAHRVLVLSAVEGRVVGDIAMPGPLPRPNDWRLTRVFREAVERVADALARSMAIEA